MHGAVYLSFSGLYVLFSCSLINNAAGLSGPAPWMTRDKPFQKGASNLIVASRASGHTCDWARNVSLHRLRSVLFCMAISFVGDWVKFNNMKLET